MELLTIGQNIRKYRLKKGIRQEALAEQLDLSPNYISMMERGEKLPSLPTLIQLANALDVTADMLLCDVLNHRLEIKSTVLFDKLSTLHPSDQKRIFAVMEAMIAYSERENK